MTLFQELDENRNEFHGLIQYRASVRKEKFTDL
jgi:hypothetical protein